MNSNPKVIKVSKLDKSYDEIQAVKGVSFEVRQGEIFGLLGPNGAGKTTIINLIVGLLKPDAGSVTIHGSPVVHGTTAQLIKVGVCPQEIILWGRLTCLEQLRFIGEMYGLDGRTALERAKLLLKTLELTEKSDKRADTLSGGMKRRLNLAMSLVHDPEILILDEPEAGLDPQSRVLVREYIKSLAREKTIILTTHNMDEAERAADRVAIIDRGSLLVLDTPEALKAQVGSGDVVEINLKNQQVSPQEVAFALEKFKNNITFEISERTLLLRALNIVQILPEIIDCLKNERLYPEDLRLRGNTLEDVFIQLTGRSLRQ